MNIYDDFFKGISPEDWEFFACDILGSQGFLIEEPPARGADGGKDAIVSYQGKRFIVSCKHFIVSNRSVTPNDEQSILDRIKQHRAVGFIGFYSTSISQGLQDRLNKSDIEYYIFDKDKISNYMPYMNAWILQKYGLPTFGKTFYLNVAENDYRPLPCMNCSKDTLSDEMIPLSMAGFVELKDGTYSYVYGCKMCISNYCPDYYPWLDYLESLYIEMLIGWDRVVEDFTQKNKVSDDFYINYTKHRSALMQKLYPAHLGVYPSSLIEW